MKRGGFTLVDVLVCAGIILLLAGFVAPSLGQARRQANMVACGSNLHNVAVALNLYQNSANFRFPPFAFSSAKNSDLPLSGHWGGISQAADPDAFGGRNFLNINFWALVSQSMVSPNALICPASFVSLDETSPGYFPYSRNYSTYCMRFTPSEDLFNLSPVMLGSRGVLGIYAQAAGGQIPYPNTQERVPQLRADRTYRIYYKASCGDGDFNPASDAIASDMFWRKDYTAPASPKSGLSAWALKWQWCHDDQFNVLYGSGGVGPRRDDGGIVNANSNSPSASLPSDGLYFATYSEKVWQFFDSRR